MSSCDAVPETAHDRIAAAALRTAGRRVVSLPAPARHHDVIAHMLAEGFGRREVALADQGFVTGSGRWARRQPALRIARKAGQLVGEPMCPRHGLFSEDVW
jgi:hypothetical protein